MVVRSLFYCRLSIDMAVPVYVILAILRNQVLSAGLVCKHVVALPVSRRLLHNVTNIEWTEIRVRLEHQDTHARCTRSSHTSP